MNLGRLHEKSDRQYLPEIGIIPARPKSLGFDARAGRFFLCDQVKRDMLQNGEMVWGMVFVNTVVVLVKSNIQNPMRIIFNFPMVTTNGQRMLSGGDKARDKVPGGCGGFAVQMAVGNALHQAV